MDAVAFPPPPAPFLDDDLHFGDFAFAPAPAPAAPPPAPQPAAFAAFGDDWGDFVASPLGSNPDGGAAPVTPPTGKSAGGAWEKPRAPLPLSLFGADDDKEEGGQDEEGPAGPPPMATAHQRAPSFASNGAKPGDLKDLIAGLYGSQPLPTPGAPEAGAPVGAEEDDDGFGEDGWEFKAAPSSDAGHDHSGGGRAHGDGIENMPKSVGSNQEDWSLFTSVNNNLNHVQTTDHVETHESTEPSLKSFSYSPANSAAILNLYKESELVNAVHVPQSCAESVLSSSDLFSNNEVNSSFGTDENHSIKSASDSILIDFYHKLREESLVVISRYKNDIEEAQKSSTLSDENNKVTAIEREIQEIWEKLQDPSLANIEEHPSRNMRIAELLNSTKEEHVKDFEQQYHLAERIGLAQENMSLAVELYKHSVSTLHTLELASKEEQCDYVSAWYSMLLSCAQELQHGAVLWQESCHEKVSDLLISEGVFFFIALGEIYRVAQVLHLSLQYFKPWVLADPGMLSKMLACWDSCTNAWASGLETALRLVVDSNHLDASIAKALLESIISINELEVANLQNFLPNNEMTCGLTLLPGSLVPGMEVIIWNGDNYFVKIANLWANRISSDPPRFSFSRAS